MVGALLSSTILLGSCSNDDLPTYSDIAVDKTEVIINLDSGTSTGAVQITEGNGNYRITVADEAVATAAMDPTNTARVIFTGVNVGETTATITDWARKSVNVVIKVTGQSAQ